jgi:hypothetical protein
MRSNYRGRLFSLPFVAVCTVAVVVMNLTTTGYAVTVPFLEDFSDSTTDFTLTAGANTTVVVDPLDSNVLRITQTARLGAVASAATVPIADGLGADDLSASEYFLASVSIRPSQYTIAGTAGGDIGLALFGSTDTVAAAPYYLFDFNPIAETFRISGADVTPTPGSFSYDATETYTLTVKGWYTGGTLNFEYKLSDPSQSTITITGSDTTPLTGTYFGVRFRNGASSTTTTATIDYDNFSISVVPEPSAISLCGIGGFLSLVVARKRKLVRK